MMLTKSNILMIGLIVMIGFGAGLHLDLYDKGDMYRIQNILSQAVVKSQSSMIQSAFMSDDANGFISHATVGFGLGSELIDPDGPAENQQEFIENKVTECIFHSDEDIDLPICIVCKLVNVELEPCEDIFLDFVSFPDGTTQDELNLGLASLGITITGKANAGFTGADDLFVWDADEEHMSANGAADEDDDIESPEGIGTSDGFCTGCAGWHILIFPDDDGTGNPDPMDDSAAGGTITMTFDTPVFFAKFDIADIENDEDAKAIAYSGSLSATQCDPATEIKTVPIPTVSDGGTVTVNVDANNVSCVEIIYEDSGGPTNFDYRCIKQLDPDTVIAKAEIILPEGYEGSDILTFEFEEPADIFKTMGVRIGIFKSVIDFEELPHGADHDAVQIYLLDNFGIFLEVIGNEGLETSIYDSFNVGGADIDLEHELHLGDPGDPSDDTGPDNLSIGKLLIMQEDNASNTPNDSGAGGILRLKSFNPLTTVSVDVVDHDNRGEDSVINAYDNFECDGTPILTADIVEFNFENSWQTVDIMAENVHCLEMVYPDSGGFTNFILGCVKQEKKDGCTPGFWKQPQHFDSWVDFTTGQSVGSVFDDADSTAGNTLLEALNFMGGDDLEGAERILLRAAVAGILNGAHSEVNYPIPVSDLIDQVNAAIVSEDRDTMLDLAALIDFVNNLGCPLNGD